MSGESAVTYSIEVDDDSDFSSPLAFQAGLSDSEYDLDSLEENGTYYWRIVVRNGCGSTT